MSVTNLLSLPSVSNVAPGNTATISLPVGGHTYDKIFIEHNVGGVANIGRIECLINGKVFQTYEDASWLKKLNTYRNILQVNGILVIHFDQPQLRQLNEVKYFGIGTKDVTTFDIRIELKATATNPSLTASAQVSVVKNLGSLNIIRAFPKSTSVAGVIDIDNIPGSARILAIHLENEDITHCELKLNNTTYYEASKALNSLYLKQAIPKPRSEMNNTFSLDFTAQGTPMGALITEGLQDFRIKTTIEKAGSINMVVEYWGLLGSA